MHTYLYAYTTVMYDQKLSQRLCIIKYSRATSRVKWLNGEKTNVSRTISVLVLRALKYFGTLRTRTEMTLETLVFSSFNNLMRLADREYFIIRHTQQVSLIDVWSTGRGEGWTHSCRTRRKKIAYYTDIRYEWLNKSIRTILTDFEYRYENI
jgi:hypothetical protein